MKQVMMMGAVLVVCGASAWADGIVLIGGSVQNGDFEDPPTGKVFIDTTGVNIPYWSAWTEVSGAYNDTGVDQGGGVDSRIMFIQPDAAIKNMTDYTIVAGDVFDYALDNTLDGRAAVEISLIYEDNGVYTVIEGTTLTLSPVGTAEGTFVAEPGASYIGKPIGLGVLSLGNWPEVDNALLTVIGRKYAHSPTPPNGAENVGLPHSAQEVQVLFEWIPGEDPDNPELPLQTLGSYYVYLSGDLNDQTDDPNLTYHGTVDAGDPISETASYGPVVLNMDGHYRWAIEMGLDDGAGGVYPPGDPNNIMGPIWSFGTLKKLPIIVQQPVTAVVDKNQTVVFEVVATSISPDFYQWFRSEDEVIDEDVDEQIEGAWDTIFEIDNVKIEDEGYYYCRILNNAGTIYSNVASLGVKRTMAHWTFNQHDFDGQQYLDVSGQGRHADPNDPAIAADSFVDGIIDEAVEINPGSFAYAGTWNPSQYTRQLTLSLWAKWDGTSGWQGLVAKRNAFEAEDMLWFLEIASGSNQVEFKSNTHTVSSPAITADQWEHIAVTFDGATAIVYRNGVEAGQGTVVFSDKADANMVIGAAELSDETGAAWLFNGALDDVRIYNYAKDFEAIAALYYDTTGQEPCIYEYAGYLDLNDDCIVDIRDFAILAASWMECGLYPYCQ